MRYSLMVLGLLGSSHLVAVELSPSDFGGSPNLVGAGPRAAGMGNAFIAVADDATASTWNPAGMAQLERPEAAISLGFYHRDTERGDGRGDTDNSDVDLDHVSIVYPVVAWDTHHSFGIAWQRRLDFTRSSGFESQSTTSVGSMGIDTLEEDRDTDLDQEGAFSSLTLSYAAEPLPGLSLGITGGLWHDDLTANSEYENSDQTTTVSELFDMTMIPIGLNTTELSQTETVSVDSGISFTLGALYRIDSTWNIALVVKPPIELDLQHRRVTHERVNDDLNNIVLSDTRSTKTFETELHLPPSVAVGTSWRYDDRITLSADLTWTDWSDLRIEDEAGRTVSPVNVNVDPDDFDAGWALRLGYEHAFILPRLVLIARGGFYYEGLPATTKAPDQSRSDEVDATIDDWYGLTAGGSVYRRSVLYDLAIQYRFANDVGSSTETVPHATADVRAVTVRAGVTVQF